MKKQTQSTQWNKTVAFALATLLVAAGAAVAADGSDIRSAQDSNRQAAQADAKAGEGVDVDQKPGGGGRRAPTAVCFTTGFRVGCPPPPPPRPRSVCTAMNDIIGVFVDVDFNCH